MTQEEFKTGKKGKGKRIALKDFSLHQNDYHFEIKEGDDLDEIGVPELFDTNLTTEKVLKG